MGIKKKFKKFVNKIITTILGETTSQKANKTLKMIGMNIFSNLIICGKLPKVPDNKVYFLSLSELMRLKIIFSKYNENAAKIQDSVLAPIIQRQIKSNEEIMGYFEYIEGAIATIPTSNTPDAHETCFEALTKMIEYMYGLRSELVFKIEQNSIKGYVEAYLDGVLKAKPDEGIYWEEFLVWLSKIINPNVAHLGELKTKLLKAKLPEGYNYKRIPQDDKNENEQESASQVIEEVRVELINEYRDREEDNSTEKGGIGKTLSDILSGKTKDKIVKNLSNKCVTMAEQILNQKLAMPEVKLMTKLSSDKIKFMGFKWATKIKTQLQGYLNTPVKNSGLAIYEMQNKIIEDIVPILTNYIILKNKEIKNKLMKCSDYKLAFSCLENIKSAMNACFSNLQNKLKKYQAPVKNLQSLYLENSQGIDSKELKKFFRVAKDKKVMFFEEYLHELYIIASKSLAILDKVIDPKSLYIDTDALQIDSAKFSLKDKKWKTFNTKDISKRITQKAKLELEKVEQEVTASKNDVDKLKARSDEIKKNWDGSHEKLKKFCEKYGDAIKDEKAKANLESIAQKIEELSNKIKLELPEYENKRLEILKRIYATSAKYQDIRKSFSKDLGDLKTKKRDLEKLKSKLESEVANYNKIDTKIRNSIKEKESKSKNKIKDFESAFDKIWNSMGEELASVKREYDKVNKKGSQIETAKKDMIKNCKGDKNKEEEVNSFYEEIYKSEKNLKADIDNKIAILQKQVSEHMTTEKLKFQDSLNKEDQVLNKVKKYKGFLAKTKEIQKNYKLSVKSAMDKIGDLDKCYTVGLKGEQKSDKGILGKLAGFVASFFK